MYQTVQSPATLKVDASGVEPGLTRTRLDPVLCCPAVVTGVLGLVMSAVISAAVNAAENSAAQDPDPGANTECTDAAFDFATSALYLPPGRMETTPAPVPVNGSVDQLLSAVRRG